MQYFWKGISDIKGLRMIYPEDQGSDKSGWYASRFGYDPEAFSGVTNHVFAKALNAEVGGEFSAGCNFALHHSEVFYSTDIYGHGKATASLNLPAGTDLRALTGELPVADRINSRLLGEPWFKHFDTAKIDCYIEAVRKVAENHQELLAEVQEDSNIGNIALTHRRK
jgi:dTDP-4-amino-4,6-dideoxygalactose transaminase